jgi:5'-3' exonuclease
MRKLVLIDFSWLYNRYYYVASYKASMSEEPVDVRAMLEHMLLQFLTLVHRSYPSAKVFMALDPSTSTLKNKEIFEGYKQNRDKEAKKEVYHFIIDIIKLLSAKLDSEVFYFIREKFYEADQLLAFMVKKFHKNHEIIIYSGDKDLLQLTSYPNTFLAEKFEKGHFLIKTNEEIFEKFKNSKGEDFSRISTNKRDILKYRSLKGDPSDNLSSAFPRIKDKEIAEIIRGYWIDDQEEPLTEVRIEKILEDLEGDNPSLANKLRENKEVWLRNYKIMDLLHVDDIEIKRLK